MLALIVTFSILIQNNLLGLLCYCKKATCIPTAADRCDTALLRDLYFSPAPPREDWIMKAGPPIPTSLPAAEELNQLGHWHNYKRPCGTWHVNLLSGCEGAVKRAGALHKTPASHANTRPLGVTNLHVSDAWLIHDRMSANETFTRHVVGGCRYPRPPPELPAGLIFHLAPVCIIEAPVFRFWRLSCHTERLL